MKGKGVIIVVLLFALQIFFSCVKSDSGVGKKPSNNGAAQKDVPTTDDKEKSNNVSDNEDSTESDDGDITDIKDDGDDIPASIDDDESEINDDGIDDADSGDDNDPAGDDIITDGNDDIDDDDADNTTLEDSGDEGSADDADYKARIKCDLSPGSYKGSYWCTDRFAVSYLGLEYCHPEELICVECYEDAHCPEGIKCNQEVYKCEDGDMSEPTLACDDPYRENLCRDPDAYNAGLRFCDPEKKICVECFTNSNCQKGFYCDKKRNTCVEGVKEILFFPCKNEDDCRNNPEADKAWLFYCDIEEGRCVECIGGGCWRGECDKKTHQCFDPSITPPPCEPPCPKGDGWYCWDDGQKSWCRQKGGYCEWCDMWTECRYVDSVCWKPSGVLQEAGGYCFRKCVSDADCKEFDEPDKPSVCYQGVCLCGWM
ncbi:MAG: hypothetical protein Kow0090_16320 [Myxococcota bacterium]